MRSRCNVLLVAAIFIFSVVSQTIAEKDHSKNVDKIDLEEDDVIRKVYEEYKRKMNKNYPDIVIDKCRLNIFKETVERILFEKLNGECGIPFGPFSDLKPEEVPTGLILPGHKPVPHNPACINLKEN